MNYRKIYIKIIMCAKNLMKNGNRPISRYCRKNFDMYFEFHHILPQSLYKQYSKNKHNLVCLTAREHFVCHKLLAKIYPCYKMYQALSEFYFRKNDKRSKFFKINSREFSKNFFQKIKVLYIRIILRSLQKNKKNLQ